MNTPTKLALSLIGLSFTLSMTGCATATDPCKDKYGGLCTSSREVYGVTRNRDQINPTDTVLKNQTKAGYLIKTPPGNSDELPSIAPVAGTDLGALKNKLPSTQVTATTTGSQGGAVMVTGPYATDAFGGQNTPQPLLRQPKVLRVWVAPYIGENNALNFPGFVYTVIQPGTWTFGQASEATQPAMPSPSQVRNGGS